MLSVNDIAYLTYGELVSLYRERAMDGLDAVGLAQTKPIALLQTDGIALYLCRDLCYQIDSFGANRKRWYISHMAENECILTKLVLFPHLMHTFSAFLQESYAISVASTMTSIINRNGGKSRTIFECVFADCINRALYAIVWHS